MSKNTGGSAFPGIEAVVTGIDSDGIERVDTEASGGMTLRAYFAAKAMQACAEGHIAHFGHDNHWPPVDLAQYSCELADALIAELAK